MRLSVKKTGKVCRMRFSGSFVSNRPNGLAEKHIIKVYVGTDGAHQDEFLRGDHPETMFRGSIATPSLEAAIINAKYVNSNPLDRISRDFQQTA